VHRRRRLSQAVSDFGGKVLKALEDRGIEWFPILRSNRRNLHPIMFGVYGGLVYHHGAGFRKPISRQEIAAIPQGKSIAPGTPEYREFLRQVKTVSAENERLSELLYQRILEGDDFVRELLDG
jgi:hypothetical protein